MYITCAEQNRRVLIRVQTQRGLESIYRFRLWLRVSVKLSNTCCTHFQHELEPKIASKNVWLDSVSNPRNECAISPNPDDFYFNPHAGEVNT